MVVISVANQKGGVGKTTSTLELASILAREGRRVLTIDLDQQCNLTQLSDIDRTKPNIHQILKAEHDPEAAIQTTNNGFDIIGGSAELSKADQIYIDHQDVYLLNDMLEYIAEECDYDFVFIDTSPARNVLLIMSYIASDYLIMCCDANETSVNGIKAISNDMVKYVTGKHASSHAKIMGAILTRYEDTNINNFILELIEDAFNDEMDKASLVENPFIMKVRKSVKVPEAGLERKSMQIYGYTSNPSFDYRQIAKKVVEYGR